MIAAITGAVDWSEVITGFGVIFGAMAVVTVAFMGGKMTLQAIRGGR